MKQFVVGIDPDSEKHGVAFYCSDVLVDLSLMTTVNIVDWIEANHGESIVFSLENVLYTSTVYSRNRRSSPSVMGKIGLNIGRVQQAQIELMRWLDRLKCPYMLYKPESGNWANNRKQFEKVTGWTGRSNKDTRSAAYFGFLELRL